MPPDQMPCLLAFCCRCLLCPPSVRPSLSAPVHVGAVVPPDTLHISPRSARICTETPQGKFTLSYGYRTDVASSWSVVVVAVSPCVIMRKRQKDDCFHQRCVKVCLSVHGDLVLKTVGCSFRSFWHRSRSSPLGIPALRKLQASWVWTNRKRCVKIFWWVSFIRITFRVLKMTRV